jgi:soluble lytic murein transglycosylase-like protein
MTWTIATARDLAQSTAMNTARSLLVCLSLGLLPVACGPLAGPVQAPAQAQQALYPNETPALRRQIVAAATRNDVPVSLVQRVVVRESTHRPKARNGPYYGLMQILPETARSMGFAGPPGDLLDAETNLKYAVRYLRGAWLVSGGDEAEAVQWYARGYYYEAKRLGLLDETGVDGRKDWSVEG